ncbi:hypothetical protein FGRMN_685 [Fusarium graminum]|nr:hypothetical protein FGRMN_685 [Fusarium graminum]
MALRLAPYNNGMRLGQGFNSYTQQICVDDAVVVDPDRIDNSVTNDGFTMRDLRFAISGAHVHTPSSDDTGDAVLVSSSGEEGTMTPNNDSSALASRSFAFQFEQLETPERRQKALILENKRIKLSKLKTLEVTEALKSADSKGLAEELANRGRSQVVTYTSRFVSKLSEVTDEMNISGSLSIKYGAIGGSALPSVNEENFVQVFGDCFISGFLEGGEFNALVSMKILNKDKKTEIAAEAKVAMTIGPVELKAEAMVNTAKRNIQSNTETTIQPWSVDILMQTAAKFPDMVAKTPQRTYAILTKYESLRSFMMLKPEKLSTIMYENAAIYTNALLDAYMDYKNIYRNISSELFDIYAETRKFNDTMDSGPLADNSTLKRVDDDAKFPANYKGLELSRRACRFQMMKIVNEVDIISANPKLSTDENRGEQYQSPVAFRDRLPKTSPKKAPPKLELFGDGEKVYSPLLDGPAGSQDETDKVNTLVADKKDISEHLRLAPLTGSDEGTLFCNLDFVKPDFALLQVAVEVSDRGVVSGLRTRYSNGLVTNLGAAGDGRKVTLNLHPEDGERVVACSIEVGRPTDEANAKERVTAIRLYTNRGPDLLGQAENWQPSVDGKGQRGNTSFDRLTVKHFDPLLANGHLKGFWGRSVNTSTTGRRTGLYRMGPIWGDTQDDSVVASGLEDNSEDAELDRPKTGGVIGLDIGWKMEANCSSTTTVQFEKSLPTAPRVLYGLRKFDIISPCGPNVGVETSKISKDGFELKLQSWNSTVFNVEANWLALPNNSNVSFQYGELDSSELPGRAPAQNASFRVYFAKPYKTVPKVQCWFTSISQPTGWRSLRCYVTNVSQTACTVNMETWAGRQFERAKVMWLAWDSESDGHRVRAGASYFKKDAPVNDYPWYGGSFAKQPVVFGALNHIDFPEQGTNLRCYSAILEATKDKLKWQAGTWADTTMDTTGMVWIGMD